MQDSKDPAAPAVLDAYPLSPIQEGMLAHALLAPGTGVDIVQIACRFREDLDKKAFAAAWERVLKQYAIFRTRFIWSDGQRSHQEVLDHVTLPWTYHDWRDLPPDAQESRFAELLLEDRTRGFAMDTAPLLRFYLAECGPDDFRFAFSFHHALLDGSSFPAVAVQAFTWYEALRRGEPCESAPEVPYRRYVDWLLTRDVRKEEAFWRGKLAGFRTPTPMPGSPGAPKDGPAAERYGEAERFLSEADSRRLEALAKTHGLTLNTLTQGAWALLLGRHAGQPEVVFGVTRRCRHGSVEGAERIVGPMLNTVPMRVRLDADQPVVSWLQGLRAEWNYLRDFEHTPAPQVQAWSEVPGGTPLFETIAVFETAPLDETMHARGDAWRSRDFWAHHQTNYPITLNGYAGTRLRLRIIYDAQRFNAPVIGRLLRHLEVLLLDMLAHDGGTLADLSMLPPEERHTVMVEWNDTAVAYPTTTLTALLETQARKSPDASAVRDEAGTLSYAVLHGRANQLAHFLRKQGVGPGSLVGVAAERSNEMVVALLGTLKAGGAYVPLDPEYPRDRLAFMLHDTAPEVLLTQERVLAALPEHGGTTVCLDRDWARIAAEPSTAPEPTSGPDDPAYMIYTSGSTGRPKGALNAHRGIVNRLLWMQDRFRLTPQDRVLQKTPFSFDVSVWEFFWPLLTGARLVMARPGGHRDPQYLSALIQREQITVLHFVPSMLRAFLADPASAGCASLRDVMCSGEALPPEVAELAFERLPARLHNLYGPTEAAVDVTCWTCEPGSDRSSVPIGRPIANTQTYILDDRMAPVPIGAAGELYLGGVQVGMGYRNRAELTAQRFVPDPFRRDAGARLYRTGDLARFLEDGNIEFLGRLDDQVKIRGNRIELGEIETVLAQQSGVHAAAVSVHRGRTGEARLVAYVVPRTGDALDISGLRDALARTLPEYMVPAVFVPMTALPLSPNGKLDRRALPAPPSDQALGAVEPRTPTEATLARIWAELLSRDRVGVTDNFFELGGDSILSIYIAVRARSAGLELLPRDILQHQTIEAVARRVGSLPADSVDQGPVSGAAPLTPVQRWFFEQRLPSPSHWNQGFLFTGPADLDPDALESALAATVTHHDALRLRFVRQGDRWSSQHAEDPVAPTLERLPAGEDVTRVADRLQASLHLHDGPMLRAAFFPATPASPPQVLLVLHHLIVDGVSWGILLADLEAAYAGILAGTSTSFPPKTRSFAEWGNGLERYAGTSVARSELGFWQGVLGSGWPALPPAVSAEPNLEGGVQVHVERLDAEETRAILRQVTAAYSAQINDVLLAGFAGAVGAWSGSDDVAFDLEGHGREAVIDGDFSRTVGWFTSVFPVRLPARTPGDPGQHLLEVKEALRAIPNHGIGFGILRYLADARELATESPALSFNYLGQGLAESRLFTGAPAPCGAWRGADNPRRYRLELNALIQDGQLELRWSWHPSRDSETTVRRMAADMVARLRALVAHCRQPNAGGYSPSDFPLAGLDREELEAFLGQDRNVADLYPLTPMQMLFYTEAGAGDDPGYEQWVYRLRGALDSAALGRAWQATLNRHPALRSIVRSTPSLPPMQVVRRSAPADWAELDWRALPPAEQDTQLAALRRDERAAGLSLDQAPMARLRLIRLADTDWVLVWSHHHIMADRLSWPVILRDVGAYYAAEREGSPLALPPAPGFRDYVAWLGTRDLPAAERFWREELDGPGAATDLGIADLPAEAETASRQELDPALTRRIVHAARSQRITLNTLIQGLWALWLARRTGASDARFGLAVAGRPDEVPGIDQTVGLFINNIPVRVRVDAAEPASAWLSRVQARQTLRRAFEYAPLARIYEWTGATGRLFDSLVVFQNEAGGVGSGQWLGPSVAITMEPVATRTLYPLTLLVQSGDSLELRLVSRSTQWDAAACGEVLSQLTALLSRFADAPMRPVSELLDLLPAAAAGSLRRVDGRRMRADLPGGFEPAAPGVERYLAGLWAELLGLDMVGRSDHLFRLGAHSLLVSRFVARVRDDLQVDLPLRTLFDAPTVAGLGEAVALRDPVPGRSARIAEILERLAGMSDEQLLAEAGGGGSHVGG